MAHDRNIVVIGGSTGAIGAAAALLRALPADFPAALFIAFHRGGVADDALAKILGNETALPTHTAVDGQYFKCGHIYVARADHHLVIANGVLNLERSPKEKRFRPCIDTLFKSAALTYGRRVVGILLSGSWGEDGTAGLWQIKNRGGFTIVEDPRGLEHPEMTQNAIDQVCIDAVLPAREIGARLVQLSTECARSAAALPRRRILIVEDESVVAVNLHQSLAAMGYEPIDWVPSGEAAIDVALREDPDLILMDIHLAGALTGIETARRIWQTQQIPIVYCTAHGDLDTLKEVQTTQSYGYLVKPFQSTAVRAAVELAIGRRERELALTK